MKVSCSCLWHKWIGLVAVVAAAAAFGGGKVVSGTNVSYDGRSLIIDGHRRILFSGSIHYPRSTPDMWPSLISKAKQGGLDVIQTYVFWNMHEPQQGQYDFSGRNDLVGFIKQIHAQGLYVNLRIGPFIEAEWNYGGFPYWLRDVPGIVFRSDNEPFKLHMKNFTTKIVNMMKSEGLYASQGGPIILSQVENEYGTIEKAFGKGGQSYVLWAVNMAVQLQTGVPWIMCKQPDAPDPVINTCNGMKCGETFTGPNSPNKPALWTENWTSFFQAYGEEAIVRTAEDIAYQTALFIARMNGSFVNYYMYHGGTNFGRTSSSFMVTTYYDQAPLDEYGLIREPKWSHLKELHAAVKQCSGTLLSGSKVNLSLGEHQDAYVYHGSSGECAAFLVNNDSMQSANVQFQNNSYQLPAKSISILPDCKTVTFNTAKASTQVNNRSRQPVIKFQDWKVFQEVVPQYDKTSLRSDAILEQMKTTKDTSDYLWYTTRYMRNSSGTEAILSVQSLGHVLRAYVNGVLVGSGHGTHRFPNFTLQNSISLSSGINNISLLSIMTGLPDSGAYLERKGAGLHGVKIQVKDGLNFTSFSWGYQVGLLGEALEVYTDEGSSTVPWGQYSSPRPLTWYKAVFDSPDGNGPVALNLGSMGKGEAWINGQSIGRYWVSFRTSSGSPSQTWYNVPLSFLRPTRNLLVLFEEEYGSPQGITLDSISITNVPAGISLDSISITNVCGHVPATHPLPVISWKVHGGHRHRRRPKKINLRCPERSKISKIVFASFGTPLGGCGTNNYAIGACHSSNSNDIVEKLCLGKRKCTILPSYRNFGGDPCPGMPKWLLVDAECS